MAPDDGVSQVPGGSKGAKRRKKHVNELRRWTHLLNALHNVFEDAFDKVARVAAKKKPSSYASKDDTRPSRSPDPELRDVTEMGLSTVRIL